MNREEAKRVIENMEIIKAYAAGAEIQARPSPTWSWADTLSPDFRTGLQYRVKPSPKEIWVNEYQDNCFVHESERRAQRLAERDAVRVAVHYREVIQEPE